MLDSDMVIVNAQQSTSGDENLYVKFFMKAVLQGGASEKQGRPIYKDVLYISIVTPGTLSQKIDRPASEFDKARFPKQWQTYLNNKESEQMDGTPVSQWPALTVSQVEELKALKFYTVEQIAAASDSQINGVGPLGMQLRTKAIAYLKNAKDSAEAQRLAKANEDLQRDNAELRAQVEALAARVEALATGEPAKRGRPRKAASA